VSRELQIISHSEEETRALAQKLGRHFQNPDVVVLTGALGCGKTVFVRGLAAALGIDQKLVNSPSFTVVNEYPGEKQLFHLDLYRVDNPAHLNEIGWDDYLSRGGLFVVEWGEKAAGFLPRRYYLVQFRILDENQREITITLVQP
jgi:tRNA threonylcarbamoyladenosine biosynthesis protein TsaE